MEVAFHQNFPTSPTRVDLQLIESKFCLFPAISLIFQAGGRILDISKLTLDQFCQTLQNKDLIESKSDSKSVSD